MAAAAASDFVGRIVVSSSRTCNCFGRIESATASGASVRIRPLHKNRASTTPGVPTLDYIVTPDTSEDAAASESSVFTVRYHPAGTAYYRSPVSFGSETNRPRSLGAVGPRAVAALAAVRAVQHAAAPGAALGRSGASHAAHTGAEIGTTFRERRSKTTVPSALRARVPSSLWTRVSVVGRNQVSNSSAVCLLVGRRQIALRTAHLAGFAAREVLRELQSSAGSRVRRPSNADGMRARRRARRYPGRPVRAGPR
ncbi:hypothetical protein U1Q18_051643 [Sarracenia purpurea var. burkii]